MFENWLKTRLKELKIDVGVYLSYITGVLEDSIDDDEKRETLTDIISSLIVSFNKITSLFVMLSKL